MTDRHSGYLVTLAKDIRSDDAENTINALRMVRGVISVEPVISNIEVHIAEDRAKRELLTKIYDFMVTLK
jgi:hypothetical protein